MDDFISPTYKFINTILALLLVLYGTLRIIAVYTKQKKKSNITNNTKTETMSLTKVPQPSEAWPFIGHLHLLHGKDPVALILGAMADKLGPIYSLRLGPRQVVVVLSAWEQVKERFTKNDIVFATRPSTAAGKHLGYNNAIFALAPYGSYWRDIRKLATQEFLSAQKVEMLSHVRAEEVDSFIKKLFDVAGSSGLTITPATSPVAVRLSELVEHLMFNISVRLIAGKRFSDREYNEKGSEAWRFEKAMQDTMHRLGNFVWSDAIPFLEWLDSLFGPVSSMKHTFKELDSVLSSWLNEHRSPGGKIGNSSRVASDLMDAMISNFGEKAVISGHSCDNVIKATSLILIIGGTDGTSIAVTWALSLLLNHPSALKSAQQELDISVGRDRWVQESDLPNLKYLQAIVKETLRLYPSIPITVNEGMEDTHLSGYLVPKGTRIVVNLWKLHRDPRVWANPCEFHPERFMTDHADVDYFKGFEYIPFSSGRRLCPGATLGLHVVQLVLARLVQGFDMSRVGDEPVDMRERVGLALMKENPLDAFLAPRLPLHLYCSAERQCI
ncbi:hypothetical protein ACFX2I_004022 [Malus domestica]|uniref:Cytochrome P450 n=1 Tax=Malus domestica TaxID=3750 RepID=A0A498IY32_MALDO|nr:cytochrome P450 82G1-like [Malus domestica]RXH87237.1 hypothetical protein DVH24_028737 [Malus domestica]